MTQIPQVALPWMLYPEDSFLLLVPYTSVLWRDCILVRAIGRWRGLIWGEEALRRGKPLLRLIEMAGDKPWLTMSRVHCQHLMDFVHKQKINFVVLRDQDFQANLFLQHSCVYPSLWATLLKYTLVLHSCCTPGKLVDVKTTQKIFCF